MPFRSKKGEITTTQVVVLIVLIASFIILLVLYFRLGLGGTTDSEICHNSVVLRGQTNLIAGPLDCKTQYPVINAETKEAVMKSLAEEMKNCWWMFGEGQIDYAGGATESGVKYSICSIIEFDEKTREKVPEISYHDFYTYLQQTQTEDKKSYLFYLYGVDSINNIQPEEQIKVDISQDKIITAQKYSILTGIDKNLIDIIDDDKKLHVYIIPTSEISTRLTEDREFITKA